MTGNLEWKVERKPAEYPAALKAMEKRVADILSGKAPEMVWLLEHPSLYTAGTSAKEDDLIDKQRFPVFQAGRGGQFTYHGPGQRVGYVMLDLTARYAKPDLRRYIRDLEEWIIRTLEEFDIPAERREGRVGLWVVQPSGKEEKIAAIGVRVRRWVSYHGIAINLAPELEHFSGIVPCGIKEHGVTSFAKLGKRVSMRELDKALKRQFGKVFG
jgi:lipoyl(octanoyl) transferase